jgi:hypothetical protein
MDQAAREITIVRYQVKPIPLVAVLTLVTWSVLVHLMIWSLS